MDRDIEVVVKHPVVSELSALFRENEKELYVVGGSVRDAFLGEIHDDFDFATNAKPDDVIKIVKKWSDGMWLVGIEYGTVGLLKGSTKIEITSLRSELYQRASRKPQVKFDSDIQEDLARRDFTINAMAVKLPSGGLIDPFNGKDDLNDKVLRTPLSPQESFSDDPLRMLRAVRFISTLGLKMDVSIKRSLEKNVKLLSVVSTERIRDELSRIIIGDNVIDAMRLMIDTGLSSRVIPELNSLKVEQDPNYHHKDVLEHTFLVIERTEPDIVLRLAALLHDIGKPACKRAMEDRIVFYNHNNVGARLARKRLMALRYPKQTVNDVEKLITMHMRAYNYRMGWTDKAVRKYVRDAGNLLPKLNALIKADCTSLNPNKVKRSLESLNELEKRIQKLEEEEESAKIRSPINGNDIMAFLEIEPGPLVGEALNYLLEAKLDGIISSKDEAYELLKQWNIEREEQK